MKVACIIGEASGRGGDPAKPLDGSSGSPGNGSGARLCRIAGVTHDELFQRFRLRNLLDYFPGMSNGKRATFPAQVARAAADAFLVDEDTILLLGKRLAMAFRVKADYLEWIEMDGKRYAVVPHPSGLNRWYNSEENRQAVRVFFEKLMVVIP